MTWTELTLRLPRRSTSASAARRVIGSVLTVLGVARRDRDDLELAMSEACTNAVRHAHGTDDFEVDIRVRDDTCTVDVLDRGCGFASDATTHAMPPISEHGGRGLPLIRAVCDQVRLDSRPGAGAAIRFSKQLTFTGTAAE